MNCGPMVDYEIMIILTVVIMVDCRVGTGITPVTQLELGIMFSGGLPLRRAQIQL